MAKKAVSFVSPNGSDLTPREERVVNFMINNGSISAMEAETQLHNHRLASTIEVLRNKKGFKINTVRVDTTNVYGEDTWYGSYIFDNDDPNSPANRRKRR